jgi:hypothetical protein
MDRYKPTEASDARKKRGHFSFGFLIFGTRLLLEALENQGFKQSM